MESDEEEKLSERKTKIKNWLKNPYNLCLVGILVLAFAIRFYYFLLTKTQPLWWDEAEYMSIAKSFAGITNFEYHITLNRFPGFPFLASLFYMIGVSNETVLKFFLAFIPSLITIFLLYFALSAMYKDKRIALISTAIFTVLWEHVFYSNRFHTENWSLIFEFLAIIILFKVYLKKEDWSFIKSKYALLWIVLFILICVLFRSGNLFIVPILVLFLVIIHFYKIPEKYRISAAIGLTGLVISGYIFMDFLSRRFAFVNQFYHYESPIYWGVTSVFYGFYQSLVSFIPPVLFYAFLLGVTVVIGGIAIFPEGLKRINKNVEDNSYKADTFNLILIAGFLFFFIFILRAGGFEYRWLFALLPGMFAFTAKGLIKFGDFVQSMFKIKYLSIFLIFVFLCLGVYTQWQHADMIVRNKLDSYQQVKDSGLWIKENSNKSDIIISSSLTQHAYYSGRRVYNVDWFSSEENFTDFIKNSNPKYLVLSIFQPSSDWAYDWPQRHNETVVPTQVYFLESSQPALIIYKINQDSL
ncbi:MAG: hypothetical protein KJ600_05540 [Nanoarchaeota archaeon]|nr:hypothetical protein [Nanoarchaeota archaeon]MBU1103991.1 hypothetical protein [Nanoarchaeota archaeon]